MRLVVFAIAVFISVDTVNAQTSVASAGAAGDKEWTFSASAFTYLLADSQHYVQPTFSADRRRLHLEARYNYEALKTGSAWLGVNFGGGRTVEWGLTPMLGAVFGDTDGVVPGLKASLSWWRVDLSSENEYVIDAGERSDSFFYSWSEFTLAPADWFRFGVVTQRTRIYQSDREIQRGLMTGFSVKRVDFAGYVFNPDEDEPRFVFAVNVTF